MNEKIKFNENTIHFKDEILKSLNEQFNEEAEKITLKDKRHIITEG